MAVRIFENGNPIQQKTVLFDKEKKLKLPKARLKTKVYIEENQLRIVIRSDKFARLVKAESSISSMPFSDNFFDILPNEEKEITIASDGSVSLKELAQSISVYSLCNIRFDKNPVKTNLKRLKVFLSPVNIGNAIHHGKLSTDVDFDDK